MDVKNINLNIDLGSLEKSFKKIPLFLDKRRRWVIIFIALMFSGHACYEYYNYIYHPVWSEKKRQEYIGTKEKDATFNENDFNAVTKEIEKRKIEFVENQIKVEKDIFKLSQ